MDNQIRLITPMLKPSVCDYSDAYIIMSGSKINNIQRDYGKHLHVLILIYNLLEYIDNYSKLSGSLWQYYRDEPVALIRNFESLKSEIRLSGKFSTDDNKKDVLVARCACSITTLKYLSNFSGNHKMFLINCETNLILTWSENCVISSPTGATKLAITKLKVYVPVVIYQLKIIQHCLKD